MCLHNKYVFAVFADKMISNKSKVGYLSIHDDTLLNFFLSFLFES